VLYVALVIGALAALVIGAFATATPMWLVALVVLPFAVPPCRLVLLGAKGPALIAVLQATARLQLLFGVVFAAALWWG
jgi:1,4-dihydroxy-2-naphthoate polyprenyltransferase